MSPAQNSKSSVESSSRANKMPPKNTKTGHSHYEDINSQKLQTLKHSSKACIL
jgi:hypothetical protein